MKRVFLLGLLFTFFNGVCQQTIIEEKFENENVPLGYQYLPVKNQIAIQKGKHIGISKNREVNKIITYDSSGNEKIWFENEKLMNPFFNYSGNILVADEYSKLRLNGDTFKIFSSTESSTFNKDYKSIFYFDDFMIMSKAKKDKFNSLVNYKDKSLEKVNINYQGFERIFGENFYTSQRAPGIKDFINKNGNIEVISKSISKDCKESKIYRTEYNSLGKKIGEIEYDILLKDYSLILSVTGGGSMVLKSVGGFNSTSTNHAGFSNTVSLGSSTYSDFADEGSVNNIIFDKEDNAYVYGMLGKKEKENLLYNRIVGYYIYKFDKAGKLIWEKKYETDKLEKIGVAYLNNTYVRMFNMNGQLQFLFASTQPDEIFMLSDINESNGDFIKSDFYTFKTSYSYDLRNFIYSNITNKESLKNKILDYEGLMLYQNNNKFKSYIDSKEIKGEIYFNTMISNDGIWLIESDNKSYYKVTYFDHK